MPAPSKAFTVIPDSDIDPDSPITTGLMTAFRDNDIHLEEWLGKNYTAAVDHDHDGVNSKVTSGMAIWRSISDFNGIRSTIFPHNVFQDIPNCSVTVPAAQLPVNREALIILAADAFGGSYSELMLVVDGVGGNQIQAGGFFGPIASGAPIVQLTTLIAGANRIIKAQQRETFGGGTSVLNTHLAVILFG